MILTPLGIDGAWLAESTIWSDERGFFREWFIAEEIKKITGYNFDVNQSNVSSSSRGTLRGIHYSLADKGQSKFVTCVRGSILDVVVDIRPNSLTYKKWLAVELTESNGQSVLIGNGLGHAFLALENKSTVSYLVTSRYSPQDEFEINPLDSDIGIQWPLQRSEIQISKKDLSAPTLLSQLQKNKLPTMFIN
jgi:dTDP-4-dehydrorhamnose 3,5-epimerase